MPIKLSHRLQSIANMVAPYRRVADIGTDHGALPMYLVENQLASFVVASDRIKTPIRVVTELVKQSSFEDRIAVRLGDGLTVLQPGEVDAVVMSGMGGMTIIEILEHTPAVLATTKRLVLQPQRNIGELRQWLQQHDWQIMDEDVVWEEGYYYEILVAQPGKMALTEEEMLFGPVLLKKNSPLLKEYWQVKKEETCRLIARLEQEKELTAGIRERLSGLKKLVGQIDEVILCL